MQLFIWNNVRVTFQSRPKQVQIGAVNLVVAKEKWIQFVKYKNFYGEGLDEFYYDTWYSNALDRDPDSIHDVSDNCKVVIDVR